MDSLAETAAGYSRVAAEYARQFFHELDQKPFDRQLLDRLAAETQAKGPLCDMGCGPGEVARYLKDRGAAVSGIDISVGMVRQAHLLNPDIPFRVGNMLALDAPTGCWAGIAAFYSIIHIPPGQVPAALSELYRVLQPGGLLLLAFHVGEETIHLERWWGEVLSIDFYFYQPAQMEAWLRAAGFWPVETSLRDPYPGTEHQSQRAYLAAYRPPA